MYASLHSRSNYFIMNFIFSLKHRPIIVTLLLGQILSLALCGTGVATQLLSGHPYNFKAPLMQTFIVYVALATIFGPILACREDFLSILKYNWWKYLIVGTIDAEANFLAVLAYQYTTLTSIQVSIVDIDCF